MLLIVFSQGSGGFSELAKRWTDIRRAVLAGLDAMNSRGLEDGAGGHYSSLNALAVPREFLTCAKLDALESVHKVLSDRFQAFVKELEIDAVNFVNTLAASSRERVSIYRTALWIWHRLDSKRWEMSCIPLRVGKSKGSLDVDHAVAYALWDAKLAVGLPTGIDDRADALLLVNMLGNCSLLEKTFNISKSDKTLRSFMEQVHEFKEGKVALSSWAQCLGLEDSMLNAAAAATDAILQAIQTRDKAIRAELIEFVKGTKSRVDL